MTVVVLGASGFLGSAVTAALSARSIPTRAVARRATPMANVEVVQADLTKPGALAKAVEGADVVVHLVSYDSGGSWRIGEGDAAARRVNVGVAEELAELAPVVVFAGSTSQASPATEYDRQKLAAEQAILAAHGISLRLPTLFGPSPQARGVVAAMIRKALDNEPLTMWNDGSITRDLLYLDDAATAFATAIDHADALTGRHWDVGSGQPVTLAELFTKIATTVAEHTGRPAVPVRSIPPPEHATAADFHSVGCDPSAFQQVTGWRARSPLDDALAHTVAVLTSGDS